MDFFKLRIDEQRHVIAQAAEALGRNERIVEKDIWVCWALGVLFGKSEYHTRLAFKGGTSLSKCFKAIHRFSEDVDVTIDYHTFGGPSDKELAGMSNRALEMTLDGFTRIAREWVAGVFVPDIAQQATILGGEVKIASDPLTVEVYYPSAISEDAGYLCDTVKIEFGARNPTDPNEEMVIAADAAPVVTAVIFPSPSVKVLVLARTFWEKATLLHSERHRKELKANAERMSRHWYDMAKLSAHSGCAEALHDMAMLTNVAEHKRRFYRSGWASYETARSGSLRLVPGEPLLGHLKVDFKAMVDAQMFFEEPPRFDEVMAAVGKLEKKVNECN